MPLDPHPPGDSASAVIMGSYTLLQQINLGVQKMLSFIIRKKLHGHFKKHYMSMSLFFKKRTQRLTGEKYRLKIID